MRTKIVENVLKVHLDIMETRELEETGYLIATDMEDESIRVCVTYSVEDLSKSYEVWIPSGKQYLSTSLKLSYTPKQEEEEI